MATGPQVPIQWIPEDDLLLKNAVEAGASLEALAKGAVQFSRRFTLQELRDRWYSLLYDADISAQASSYIFELEISGFKPASRLNRSENNFTGNIDVSQKRKFESIRRKYYAMRKKFRREFFSNSDLGFFEPNPHEFSGNADLQEQVMLDGVPLGQNCILGDDVSDHLGLEEEDLDILRHAFPETVRDIVVASGSDNVTHSGLSHSFEGDHRNRIMIAPEQPHLRHWRSMQEVSAHPVPVSMSLGDMGHTAEDMVPSDIENKENASALYAGEFADPDSLLNLSHEDEILLDVELTANKYNADTVRQDSHKDDMENEFVKVERETVTIPEASPMAAPATSPVMLELADPPTQGAQQVNRQPEADVPLKSTSKYDCTELSGGKICCVLNTEDTEIPCNDDIFLLIHPSLSFGPSASQPHTKISMDTSVVSHEKDNKPTLNLPTNAKNYSKASGWPRKVMGMHGLQDLHSVNPLVHDATKTEMHDSRTQTLPPGFVNTAIGDNSKIRSAYAPKVSNDRFAEKEVAEVDKKVGDNPAIVNGILRSLELGPAGTALSESVVEASVSDQEESQIDDDVPYFSDVEAMILEMDLDPCDQHSHINRKVPSSQYDDSKRTIMRLEQASRSCLQRAMTSQDAVAVLYGRHLRHYIRKPEVLLGRSTDDFDVDIDLRKEGRANKISRRQAIIKMEADGSFFLKNLGKSSVSVNGMAVETGQLHSLSSSCLIEIKGLSFVFEVNQGYVRKHLGNFCKEIKGKTKSDWSADEEQ